jgi:hypothetical protein
VATIDPLVIKLQADVNDLKAGLAQATSAIKGVDDSVKQASTGMTSFIAKIKQVGATMGVAFAGTAIVKFGKDTILAASNMNESLSKMNVVFGENASAVEKWANTSAEAMGLSKQKTIEAAGTYGNLFQAFGIGQDSATKMSTSLVQLASDMASFNNTSVDDALLALRSGLSGETEPLKRFGIALSEVRLKEEALSMGLIKTTSGVLPPAIKAQAAFSLAMKDSALAQGDFARTADGTANTMKILQAKMENAKAALGAGLLPVFQGLLLVLKPIISGLEKFGNFLAKNKDDVKVFVIAIATFTAAWGAYTIAVNAAKIAQAAFNAVLKVNPMVAIATAIGLVAVGLVRLFKSNEAFRNAVIATGKAGLMAFASIVPMIGKVFEGIMKVATGPLRALLSALSHLPGVGKYAKAGLDVMNKGLNGISDFADGAARKAKELASNLDKLGKEADKSAKKVDTAVKGTTTGGDKTGGISAADKKKIDGYMKDVKEIYAQMNEVTAEASEKKAKELTDYQDKQFELHKRYDEQVLDITKSYNKKIVEIEKTKQEKITDLQKVAAEKRTDLVKSAAEKERSILQQSIDRLRSAFASKTSFNLTEAFGTGSTATGLISKLKESLTGAKKLQENAADLAGKGYSQVFIEEVVKNGPEIGNKIADALKAAGPEATKELQDLWSAVDTTSRTGLDALAATMNAGGKLATDELRTAYSQVAIDLKNSLAEVDAELMESLAEANKAYSEAMTEAKIVRDEALAEAQKDLTDALVKAQKEYEKAIDEINKATQKKLDELQAKLRETMALIAAISAAQAAAAAMAMTSAPVTTGTITSGGLGTTVSNPSSTITVNNQFNSSAAPNPNAVSQAAVSGIKYGAAIVPTSNFTYGAGNPKSPVFVAPKPTSTFSYGSGNPLYGLKAK